MRIQLLSSGWELNKVNQDISQSQFDGLPGYHFASGTDYRRMPPSFDQWRVIWRLEAINALKAE